MTTTLHQDNQCRLADEQLAHYRREGYLSYRQPVLASDRFFELRDYFDKLLAALPTGQRPESMDVPHFMHPKLLDWAFDPAVLRIVEPILGPDIALFSTHFICKPHGNGKRVPWHEDSSYWKGRIEPMQVCTLWLALDPSTKENGCMKVIPRTHVEGQKGFSEYSRVDPATNVFDLEVVSRQRDDSRSVYLELDPNQCTLHDARVIHGSEANTSTQRRCGWTLRFCSTRVKFNEELFGGAHLVYLAQGVDHAGNRYADPTRVYPEVLAKRGMSGHYRHAH